MCVIMALICLFHSDMEDSQLLKLFTLVILAIIVFNNQYSTINFFHFNYHILIKVFIAIIVI